TRCLSDWSSDVCSSDLVEEPVGNASGYLGTVSPAQRVFVCDQRTIGLRDRGRDGVPIKRVEAAQVDQFYLHALFALKFLGGLQQIGRASCRERGRVAQA